jgi:nucleotide-binding universal stress UspA family protein
MVRNILIGLDGSLYAERSVGLGIRWARHTGALLVGVGVVDEPTIRKPEPTGIGGSSYKVRLEEHHLEDARKRVATFLDVFTRMCVDAGVPWQVRSHVGLPAERLLFESEDFDLTLLGRRTYFHFETQNDPDETLVDVLRKSRRPVVAVGECLPQSRSVVVAYDATPPAVRALEAFQRSGLEEWQAVRVVSVSPDIQTATRHAAEAARYLRFYNISAEACPLLPEGPVADLLLGQAQELGAGMLVMGAFGRSRLRESLLGSTTKAILQRAQPLLFLHH